MNRVMSLLFSMVIAMSANAKGLEGNATIEATTYADGVLFQVDKSETNLQLNISGPTQAYSQRYSDGDSIFLGIQQADGQVWADGLYKYEVWPVPAVSISREESSKMPDRNSLVHKSRPPVFALSGNFRISNGMVVDPDLGESDSLVSVEALQ